jgi:putative peptidoglycan lipid II flippase
MTKAFLTLFSGSLLSKVVGLFRELIFAFYYGTTAIASSFRLSQTAIFIPIQFLTTDIFNAGFLPLYTKYLKIDYKKATIFYWIIQTLLIVLSLFLTTMLFFYANSIIRLLAPGFNEENIAIAISFLEILSFAIPFFLLSGLFNYLEMAHNSYFLASIRTVIQSLGIILGVLLSHYFDNILLLAWGFNIAYILFFIISLIRVIRLKRVPSLSLFDKTVVKEVFNRFILIIKPLLLLPFLLQANIAIERMIASLISIDSIASFDYARFVTETVVVLLAVPVGLISLSSFSTLDREELNQKLKLSLF